MIHTLLVGLKLVLQLFILSHHLQLASVKLSKQCTTSRVMLLHCTSSHVIVMFLHCTSYGYVLAPHKFLHVIVMILHCTSYFICHGWENARTCMNTLRRSSMEVCLVCHVFHLKRPDSLKVFILFVILWLLFVAMQFSHIWYSDSLLLFFVPQPLHWLIQLTFTYV